MMADEPVQDERLAEALKALADPTRLRILRALGRTGCCSCAQVDPGADGMCCCDVEELTGLAQSTVSHHLDLLRRAGLVKASRLGKWTYYRRDDAAIRRLTRSLRGTLLDK